MDNEVQPKFWKVKVHKLLQKLGSWISALKQRLKIDPQIRFFIAQPLKVGNSLLKKIFTDDKFYHSARYAWVRPEDAKKMFVYGCTRQILKAGIALLDTEEFIYDPPPKGKDEDISRIIIETVIDSQNVLARKLLELLVNLINFTQFDRDEAYRIYLNAENFEHFLGRQADFKGFYGSNSGNINSSIGDFKKRIEDDLSTLKLPKLWFLREDWNIRSAPPIFTSVRERYKQALPSATDDEKIILGLSYSTFFSELSVSAHPVVGSRNEKHQDFQSVRNNIQFISMLCQHIARRANLLMGYEDPLDLMQRMIDEDKSDASQLMRSNTKVFKRGDLVFAMDDLCEIEDCRTSAFGYTSCEIRFLTRPPLPETPTDWIPTHFVKSIVPKEKVREFVFKFKDDPSTSLEVKKALLALQSESDEALHRYLKLTFIELHKRGILIPMLFKKRQSRAKKAN